MKLRPAQFGVRENTASPRQHAPRFATDTHSASRSAGEENPAVHQLPSANIPSTTRIDDPLSAASEHAATGEERRGEDHLLPVREIARLLQVPVSWVYGRLRRRSTERLPGYRLGKYWRFREDEVLAWVECHRGGSHAA